MSTNSNESKQYSDLDIRVSFVSIDAKENQRPVLETGKHDEPIFSDKLEDGKVGGKVFKHLVEIRKDENGKNIVVVVIKTKDGEKVIPMKQYADELTSAMDRKEESVPRKTVQDRNTESR